MFIINPYRFGTTTPSFTGFLDLYPGAAYAFSTRRLSSTYTGSALKLRESATNAEANVAFNTSNEVSLASVVTITNAGTSGWTIGQTMPLSTFVGSNNAFVTTWYDQSGNNRHVLNGTSLTQPTFITGGVIETVTGIGVSRPAIKFTGASSTILSKAGGVLNISDTVNFSGVIAVAKFDVAAQQVLFNDTLSSNSRYGFCMQNVSANDKVGFTYRNTTYTTPQVKIAATNVNGLKLNLQMAINSPYTTTFNASIYENTVLSTGTSNAPFASGTAAISFGTTGTGKFAELIAYQTATNFVGTNKTGMENNVNTFYQIY